MAYCDDCGKPVGLSDQAFTEAGGALCGGCRAKREAAGWVDEPDELDTECPTCGKTHPPCTMCGAPTRCPPDEPGEPFTMCNECDAKMAGADIIAKIAKIARQIIRNA